MLVAFEQELSRFIKYIKKKSESGLRNKRNDEEPLARGYDCCFFEREKKKTSYSNKYKFMLKDSASFLSVHIHFVVKNKIQVKIILT